MKPDLPQYRIVDQLLFHDVSVNLAYDIEELCFKWWTWSWDYTHRATFRTRLDAEKYLAKLKGIDICGNCGTALMHDSWGLFCPNLDCECWYEVCRLGAINDGLKEWPK